MRTSCFRKLVCESRPAVPRDGSETGVEAPCGNDATKTAIETGAAEPIFAINPEKYIQHNLSGGDGLASLGALLYALPKSSAKVNPVRVFQDGDFVSALTDYNFLEPKIGFNIVRFENGKIIKHCDTIEAIPLKSEW